MADKGGISGLAVTAAGVGAFLLYAGIKDVPLQRGLREILSGQAPTATPPVVTSTAGFGAAVGVADASSASASSSRLADAARKYLGKPYVWGATGPNAFDCSGLVYRSLRDIGVNVSRLTSAGFRVWAGAHDIPRAQCASGDLVCYLGHVGIATSNTRMIHAPRVGKPVQEATIYNGQGGPIIRRVG